MAIVVKTSGKTDVGMKRAHNEDNYHITEGEMLYLVADGMGGHASGEVASELAVKTIADFFLRTRNDDEVTWPFKMDKARGYEENRLATGVKLANLRIFETSQKDSSKKGMGTTVVSIFFSKDSAYIAHVGDSRVYRVRSGEIEQMTEDHSLLNDYIKMKKLTPEEIENFPHKNVIVRALGMKESVQVDVRTDQPRKGDVFLLCSDGLSGMVPDPDLCRIVHDNQDNLDLACEKLIELANKNGGTDNITALLVRIEGV